VLGVTPAGHNQRLAVLQRRARAVGVGIGVGVGVGVGVSVGVGVEGDGRSNDARHAVGEGEVAHVGVKRHGIVLRVHHDGRHVDPETTRGPIVAQVVPADEHLHRIGRQARTAVGGGGDAVGPDERAAAELALARVTRPLGGGEGDEEGVLVWWADLNATDDVGEEVVRRGGEEAETTTVG